MRHSILFLVTGLVIGGAVTVAILWPGAHAHEDHAHEPHEETSVQVTVWSGRHEVFLEHPPIVAGAAETWAVHVTDLRTFEPRREGPVVFLLSRGTSAPVEHMEPAPARPGIYTPALSFPAAGEWRVVLRIPSSGETDEIVLPVEKVFASPAEAERSEAPEPPEGIAFLKEQQWLLGTKIEPAGRRRMVERLRLPGVALALPGGRAEVTPPVDGRILPPAESGLPAIGARVEAGQVLARVQPSDAGLIGRLMETEAAVVRTNAALEQADSVLRRVRRLAAEKAKSERELQEAEYAAAAARADHDAAVAVQKAYQKMGVVFVTDSLPSFELRAPITGVVTEVSAAAGEIVHMEHAVFTIADASRLYVEACVPESGLGRIPEAPGAQYETPDAPGRLTALQGPPVWIGVEVETASRTVPLLYEAANPDGRLKIGMALTLYVETSRAEEAIAVPREALVEEDGRWVVFVQTAGATFERRDVTPGIRDSGHVQIVRGVSEGERVVTRGAYAVRLASVSASIPAHGHAH